MPGVCRRLVFDGDERRADLLVNLTNDGWFARSIGGRENHLLAARWRCVELRTPMIRAANTGISAMIDTDARVEDYLESNTEGVLIESNLLSRPGPITLFALTGDLVGWLCLAGTGLITLGSLLPRRTASDPGRSVEHAAPTPT
jgi:apolipoprotein N-acyltransferase